MHRFAHHQLGLLAAGALGGQLHLQVIEPLLAEVALELLLLLQGAVDPESGQPGRDAQEKGQKLHGLLLIRVLPGAGLRAGLQQLGDRLQAVAGQGQAVVG